MRGALAPEKLPPPRNAPEFPMPDEGLMLGRLAPLKVPPARELKLGLATLR